MTQITQLLLCKPATLAAVVVSFLLAGCASAPDTKDDGRQALGQQPLEIMTHEANDDARKTAMYNVLVGELAVERDALDVSVDAYMELVAETTSVGAARRATQIAIFAKQRDKALVAAKRWVELSPNDFEGHKTYVELLIENAEYDMLLPSAIKLVEIAESGRGEGYAIISTLLAKADDVEKAIKVFDELRLQFVDNVYANYHFVRFAVERSKPELALNASQRLVKMRPEWEEALKLDAQAHILAGQPERALSSFNKLLQSEPDSWRLRLDYLFLLIQAGRGDEAFVELKAFDKQFGDKPEAIYQATRVAIEIEQYDYAKRMLVGLIGINRRVNESHFWLGRIEEDLNNTADAILQYSAVADGQFFVEAHSRIAAMLADDGRLNDANLKMSELREQRSDMSIQLYLFETEYLRKNEAFEMALAVLDEALVAHSQNLELRYSRALIAERLDKLEQLETDLRLIIDVEPNSAHALNALGYTLADKTDRLEEAEELIERAYQLSPEDFAIIDSMGWLAFRQGDFKRALMYLKEAYIGSNDAEVAAHLIEVLSVSGDQAKAREVYQDSAVKNPQNDGLNEIKVRSGL